MQINWKQVLQYDQVNQITDLDQAFATLSRFTEWALPSSGQNIDVATYFPNETLIITLMPKREKILPMMPIF